MSRWTLAFADTALERGYRIERSLRISRRQFVTSLLLTLSIWVAVAVATTATLDVDTRLVWEVVALGALAPQLAVLGLALALPAARFRRTVELATCVVALVVGLAGVGLSVPLRRYAGLFVGGQVLYFVGVHGLMNLRFSRASLVSALLCLASIGTAGVDRGLGGIELPFEALWLFSAQLLGMRMSYVDEKQRRRLFLQQRTIEDERQRADELLRNMVPTAIAERLKLDPSHIADRFDDVTVLFADIVGFTDLSARLPPEEVVAMLNRLFSAFDQLADEHGLEKIKTIGDAYMVVGGLPRPRDGSAADVARFALAMRDVVVRIGEDAGHALEVRVGIHTGPVVAGVIGKRKLAYDLWGDTVNTASRMESHGVAGEIQVSDATHEHLAEAFALEDRGTIPIKGKGSLRTWLLKGCRHAA